MELPGVALLRQGKHCFLEKSIARTAEEFRPVLDGGPPAGPTAWWTSPGASTPPWPPCASCWTARPGRPLMVAAQMVTTQVGSGPGQRNPQHPAYRPETEGGGMLHWLGQHFLEVLSFLGGDVRQVSAMCPGGGQHAPDPRMDDVSVLAFRFASGAMGALHVGYLNAAGGANRDVVHLGAPRRRYWPGLGVAAGGEQPGPLLGRQSHPQLRVRPPPPRRGLRQLGVDVPGGGRLRARIGRGAPAVGPAEAMRVLQLTDAAYAASATQRWVSSLPETP